MNQSTKPTLRSTLLGLGLAAALMTTTAATAQEEAPAETKQTEESALPDGFAVLERHIEAVGGKEAVDEIKSVRMNGTFEIVEMQMKGDLLIQVEAPAKMAVVVELPGMGVIHQGTDGEVAWQSMGPGMPPQIVDGEQAEALKSQARFADAFKPREAYKSAKNLGKETFEGEEVYRLELVKKGEERVGQALFNVETGLQVAEMAKSSPDSPTYDLVTKMADYKLVGDKVMFAHKMIVALPQFNQVIEMATIELNPEFEEGLFDAPGAL